VGENLLGDTQQAASVSLSLSLSRSLSLCLSLSLYTYISIMSLVNDLSTKYFTALLNGLVKIHCYHDDSLSYAYIKQQLFKESKMQSEGVCLCVCVCVSVYVCVCFSGVCVCVSSVCTYMVVCVLCCTDV